MNSDSAKLRRSVWIGVALIFLIFLVVVISAVVLVPRTVNTLSRAQTVLGKVESFVDEANSTLEAITVEEVRNFLKSDFVQDQLRQEEIDEGLTLDQAINPWLDDPMVTQYDAEAVNLRFTVGDVINVIGEENARNYILNASTAAGYQPDYDQNADNLIECWGLLIAFSLLYAGLSVICLEFIDRDKR